MRPRDRKRGIRSVRHAGFSLIEMLIVMVLLTIVLGAGYQGLRSLGESSIVDRAATSISGDVKLTRAYAIQRRSDVTMKFEPAARSYVVRDGTDTLVAKSFSASSQLPLTIMTVTPDDSITFNSRGLMVGKSAASIDVERFEAANRVLVSALGRTRVTQP